jgi:RNA polymerase sigma-70 factor (ECF subfamily)
MMRPSLPEPGDETLACQARQGCAESFEALMRRYQAPVLHFLRHRGCGAEAEDVLQETFVRAYTNLHRYRPQAKFAPWLFTIARRLSINHHRRMGPERQREAVDGLACSSPGPMERLADEESRQRLWDEAARVLSEGEYTAVWLHYVEQMPAREIAVVLGRTWVGVKTLLFRARRRLATVLAGWRPESAASEASSVELDVEANHV